ncbi:MAG: hypothetical protein Q4D38_08030 [Planctomycetia bacterium]|nr:hypothetical protein [Planctomycetia bacterium]
MAKIISNPLSSVPFFELAGSPTEKYTVEGFSAERRFLVAWEKRDDFARDIMGDVSTFDYRTAAYYPNRPSVFPVSVKFEPADGDTIVCQALEKLHEDLNSYDGWAIATVEYSATNDEDFDFAPETESGTSLTYRLSWETEEFLLPSGNWTWQDTLESAPNDLTPIQRIPQTIHTLVWSQVVSPPWNTILEAQGKINRYEFLNALPGTLLFEGATANRLYRSTFQNGESPFCWAITYTFRQKSIHHQGETFGWNDFFRADDGMWVPLVNNGKSIYDKANFEPLFVSEI